MLVETFLEFPVAGEAGGSVAFLFGFESTSEKYCVVFGVGEEARTGAVVTAVFTVVAGGGFWRVRSWRW